MKDMPYRNLLGCIQYVAGRCRPGLTYISSALAQVSSKPRFLHWKHLVNAFRSLHSTRNQGVWLLVSSFINLQLNPFLRHPGLPVWILDDVGLDVLFS